MREKNRLKIFALLLAMALCLALPDPGAVAEERHPDYSGIIDGFMYNAFGGDELRIIGWRGDDVAALIIPAELDGWPVKTIARGAFKGKEHLSEVIISEGIAVVEQEAFDGCTSLSRVSIPASVTGFEGNPFSRCDCLQEIVLADGHPTLEVVDGALFNRQTHCLICYLRGIEEESYKVPEGTRSIADKAFSVSSCDKLLNEVIVPEGVVSIGEYAFEHNSALNRIELPDSLIAIGQCAFAGCNHVVELRLSGNTVYFGRYAFDEVDATIIVPPDSYAMRYAICNEMRCRVQDTEPWTEAVVANCEEWISLRSEPSSEAQKLAEIPLGARVWVAKYDGEFCRCSYQGLSGYALEKYLEKAPVDEAVGQVYEQDSMRFETLRDGTLKLVADYDDEAKSLDIPSEVGGRRVTAIGKDALNGHYDLETLVIPDSVTVLGEGTFGACISLRRVKMPSGPVLILGNPFSWCPELKEIEVSPNHPTLEVVDSVLFSKQDRRLICYPCGLEAETYVVPQGTLSIDTCAFTMEGDAEKRHLNNVILPEGMKVIYREAFHPLGCELDQGLEQGLALPQSLIVMGEYSYMDVQNLPSGLAFIGEDACGVMNTVVVPQDSYVFDWCAGTGADYTVQDAEAPAATGQTADPSAESLSAASEESGTMTRATVVLCDEWVSLRDAPSADGKRLTKVPLEARVEVLALGGEFWLCRYQGMTGYIMAQYLQPETAEKSDAEAIYVLPNVREYLSLRNASGETIAKIKPGERMKVLGWRGKDCMVEHVSTGKQGFVHSGYIMAEDLGADRWPYDYDALLKDIGSLQGKPGIAVESIATTADNREVWVIRCGDENATHHILIQCAMHAREIMTSRVGGDLLRSFVEAYPTGIEDVCVHIVPLVNPDGQAVALYGPNALRDGELARQVSNWIGSGSYQDWKANACGVDLNRNLDSGWNALTGRTPGSMRYRGPEPHSEAESKGLVEYVARYPFDCTVSIHSYGSLIYWLGATGELEARTRSMASVVSGTTGYEMVASESGVEKGGFKDWALEKAAIPSVTIEIGSMDSVGSLEECSAISLRFRGLIGNLAAWAKNN